MQVSGQLPLVPSQSIVAQPAPTGIAPAVITMHVPIAPAVLQASQLPAHSVAQHTPSTQLPDMHAPSFSQALPTPSTAEHTPDLQKEPETQSLSALHFVRHSFAPH